jgi:death-on-curing protein
MTAWSWVDRGVVLAIHDEQIAEHGGQAGTRDAGLLESALARPVNKAAYEDCDAADLAAAYAYGIARDHPFLDGNKRTSLVLAELFLALNGVTLAASDGDCLAIFMALADGSLSEAELAEWIRGNLASDG